MLEMFLERILHASSKILDRKTYILSVKICWSYWWMNFSHVAQSCYTHFIDNFDHITAYRKFKQFYWQLRLGLAQSSHQINLESFFYLVLIAFAADIEQIDISFIMFCFWFIISNEDRFTTRSLHSNNASAC